MRVEQIILNFMGNKLKTKVPTFCFVKYEKF